MRAATAQDEVDALAARFKAARDNADKRGLLAEFNALVSEISTQSHVVVAMPLLVARMLLNDSKALYAGYENLVGSGTRTPAPFKNDSDRSAVAGKIFGTFASDIRYGVLSLDGTGLRNYGSVFMRLRDVTIARRVSFLHENSFLFLDDIKMTFRGDLPRGFTSTWDNRHELAVAKIEPGLTAASNRGEWASQLVVQGSSRSNDSCVEAHIFGSFNADSVESVSYSAPGSSRAEKNDIDCINESMAGRKSGGIVP